jgi:nucleoside-diphosphate-sugar epimerase
VVKKKILLTGATGFLGSHLLENFIVQGFDVAILKRSTSKDWRIIHLLNEFKSYDIDKITLEVVFNEFKPDIIIHTACSYGRNKESIADILNTNLIFSVDLLEHAILNNTSTFINTDSLLPRSINNYSLSKAQFSEWLQKYSTSIQCINFKIEHMYGVRDDSNKFIPWIINEMINKNGSINLTSGIQLRDFIEVSDVVSAYDLVVHKRSSLQVWNEFELGTTTFTEVKKLVLKLALMIENKFDKKILPRLNFGAVQYRKEEIMIPTLDNSKLIELGWKPVVTVDEGVRKILKEYK